VLGIKTEGDTQVSYVDTPGLHKKLPRKVNKYMNKAALSAITDVDVICFVVDALHFNEGDEWVLSQLQDVKVPVILVINKVDSVTEQGQLLKQAEYLSSLYNFKSIVPVSAISGYQLDKLQAQIKSELPETDFFFFPEDAVTDKDHRFQVAEIIREKLVRVLGQELPYETHVVIDRLKKEEAITHIDATVLVARDSQKGIVIGKQGAVLKKIGTQARKDIEQRLNDKVMLKLFVKVKDNWSDSDLLLQKFGYDNE